MTVIGAAQHFRTKFKYTFKVDGVGSAEFSKVGPLQGEFGDVDHRQGGQLVPTQLPGLLNFANVVCERGKAGDLDFFELFDRVGNGRNNAGLIDPQMKFNAEVAQLDFDNSTLERYRLFNCYPKIWNAGEWDNSAEEVLIEMLTLRVQYIRPIRG